MTKIRIRPVTEKEVDTLLNMIRGLAEFLHYEHVFVVKREDLVEYLFRKPFAQCLVAELVETGGIVGYTIYYPTFSTFRGRPGLHIEDLYVIDGFRSKGVGRLLLHAVCKIATEGGFSRIQWEAPVNNEPARKFYDSLDVPTVSGWIVYRITNALHEYADSKHPYELLTVGPPNGSPGTTA